MTLVTRYTDHRNLFPVFSKSFDIQLSRLCIFFMTSRPNDIPGGLFLHFTFGTAAAAKLLQSCPTLCDSVDSSLPGSSVPGILQARILEWVAISFSNAGK